MGKTVRIALLILIIAVAAALAWFYFYPKDAQNILVPEIDQLKKVSVSLKGDTAFAVLNLRLKNKGIFKINIDSLQYRVTFDTLMVMSKTQSMDLVIKPGDIDSMKLPVAMPYKRIIERIGQLQERDSTDITTELRVVYRTIFGRASLPHKKTHRIGTPRPPEFELEGIDFVKYSGKQFYFNARLKMINHGNISLRISRIRYTLNLKDHLEAHGEFPAMIVVNPGATITETVPLTAEFSNLFKTAYLIVMNDDVVPYKVDITGFVETGEDKEPTEVRLRKSGMVELRKKDR